MIFCPHFLASGGAADAVCAELSAEVPVAPFPLWAWVAFAAFVVFMLALDLGVFHKSDKEIGLREAAVWSIIWVALAGAAFLGIWAWRGNGTAQLFSAGYLLELALSIDNLFVFILIFSYFGIPEKYRHRVLFWGILGAVVFRAIFIFGGVALTEKFEWILWLFGAFLLFTGARLFFPKKKADSLSENTVIRFARRLGRFSPELNGHDFLFRKDGLLYASPLLLTLIVIELSDILFAVDSVPAVLGILPREGLSVQEKMFVAFTSNIFAVLGLRSFFSALSGIMKMLRFLHFGLGIVLIFIGVKLIFAALPERFSYEFSVGQSLAVLGIVFAVSVALSLIFPKKSGGNAPAGTHRKKHRSLAEAAKDEALPPNVGEAPEAVPAAENSAGGGTIDDGPGTRSWIGVDLDGTLAQYDGWRGLEHVGKPVPVMLARVRHWLDEGYTIKIFTARATEGEKGIAPIKKWLAENGLPDLEVTNCKDFAMIELWDDRAVQVVANTGKPFLSPSIFGRPSAPILPDESAGDTFYLLKKRFGNEAEKGKGGS